MSGSAFSGFPNDPLSRKGSRLRAYSTTGLPAVFLPRGEAVADLAFMQLCRGFVLSNSTYSWWAQYLAKAADKLVLAPEKWYAHTKKSALYLPDWQLIETD